MLSRKVAADAGQNNEPTITRGWGKGSSQEQYEVRKRVLWQWAQIISPSNKSNSHYISCSLCVQCIQFILLQSAPPKPTWQEEMARRRGNELAEKETVLDDTMPRGRDRLRRKDTLDMRSKNDPRRRDDDRRGRKERSRRDSDRYDDDDRGKGGRSRKTSRKHTNADDEGYRTKHRGRGKRDARERDASSDYDSDYEDKHRRRRRQGKRRGPTNIDDFDEDDYSDSDSYSSDYSSSSSGSDSDDSRRRRKRKVRSSSSVSDLTGTAWALSGEGGSLDNIGQRIKQQQDEIKKQLAALTQLQSETGVKALPTQHQTVLQKDLEKLEQLQAKLRHKQGDQNLQMQLLGQQLLLCEHLKEAQQVIASRSDLGLSPSGQNIQLQIIQQQQQAALAQQQQQALAQQQQQALAQQQQQALAQQQQQALAQQQRQIMFRQMQAEQQRQMMLAAEQQRQMQMGLMPSTPFVSPQQPFGMGGGLPQMQSPYAGTVGYF